LHALSERLPGFRFVPALSEPDPDQEWDGETGLITDVVRRNESSLEGKEAYVCGPPPMVDAAMETLRNLGVSEDHIYHDKFTTTGESEGDR
jgi:propane monooxygenase reductase subunit